MRMHSRVRLLRGGTIRTRKLSSSTNRVLCIERERMRVDPRVI